MKHRGGMAGRRPCTRVCACGLRLAPASSRCTQVGDLIRLAQGISARVMPLLSATGIDKRFGGVVALDGAEFACEAGKSTRSSARTAPARARW